MKLNRSKLRKLIFEVLNENKSPDQNINIQIGDALHSHFYKKFGGKKSIVNSNGFGFRQNANVDSIGEKILNGGKEGMDSLIKDKNITYVFGFLHPRLFPELKSSDLEKEVQSIASKYNVNIKIGRTNRGTRYTAGDDAAVYTINRID